MCDVSAVLAKSFWPNRELENVTSVLGDVGEHGVGGALRVASRLTAWGVEGLLAGILSSFELCRESRFWRQKS